MIAIVIIAGLMQFLLLWEYILIVSTNHTKSALVQGIFILSSVVRGIILAGKPCVFFKILYVCVEVLFCQGVDCIFGYIVLDICNKWLHTMWRISISHSKNNLKDKLVGRTHFYPNLAPLSTGDLNLPSLINVYFSEIQVKITLLKPQTYMQLVRAWPSIVLYGNAPDCIIHIIWKKQCSTK